MRISIICFSLTGYMTAEDLQKDLQGKGYTAEIYKKSKYLIYYGQKQLTKMKILIRK